MTIKDTMYGKQHVIIKDKNNKVIYDYWVEAKIYEENNVLNLAFDEMIRCSEGETMTLGEFKQDVRQ